jgi:hypothetical protein
MWSARVSLWVPFVPWLLFDISDRNSGIGPEDSAILAAGIAALLWVTYLPVRRSGWPLALGVLLFGGLAGSLGTFGQSILEGYDRALAFAVLAVALGVSSFTSPFTLESLRRQLPTNGPLDLSFLKANRRLTLMWSICAAGVAASLALGPKHGHPISATILDWFIPSALTAFAGVLATQLFNREASTAHRVTMRTAFGLFDIELSMDPQRIEFGAPNPHPPQKKTPSSSTALLAIPEPAPERSVSKK